MTREKQFIGTLFDQLDDYIFEDIMKLVRVNEQELHKIKLQLTRWELYLKLGWIADGAY